MKLNERMMKLELIKEHFHKMYQLKWQAYGYKNMAYFALKIMQKCGYLKHCYYLQSIATS